MIEKRGETEEGGEKSDNCFREELRAEVKGKRTSEWMSIHRIAAQ